MADDDPDYNHNGESADNEDEEDDDLQTDSEEELEEDHHKRHVSKNGCDNEEEDDNSIDTEDIVSTLQEPIPPLRRTSPRLSVNQATSNESSTIPSGRKVTEANDKKKKNRHAHVAPLKKTNSTAKRPPRPPVVKNQHATDMTSNPKNKISTTTSPSRKNNSATAPAMAVPSVPACDSVVATVPRVIASDTGATAGSSARKKGRNFSPAEVDHMLHLIRTHLPVGVTEWVFLAEEHAKKYPDNGRDENSLKLKFNKLKQTNVGTGNVNIPKHVKEALSIQKLINQRVDSTTLDDNDDNAGSIIPEDTGGDGIPDGSPDRSERADDFISSATTGGLPVVPRIRSNNTQRRRLLAAVTSSDAAATLNTILAHHISSEQRQDARREERERIREEEEKRRELRREEFLQSMAMAVASTVTSIISSLSDIKRKKKKKHRRHNASSDSSEESTSSSSSDSSSERNSKKRKKGKKKKKEPSDESIFKEDSKPLPKDGDASRSKVDSDPENVTTTTG